jgi:uncharacterized protein
MHPATAQILQHFAFDHLPPHLQEVSHPFHALAHDLAGKLGGPELSAGLRKLLEAKDCMVRAAVTAGPVNEL